MFAIDIEVIIKIVLSLFLSAIIGLERERHSKPAGLRTHILVCVGANLIMLVSLYMSQKYEEISPSRIAAQVVSGIGFLGAGTIIVSHGLVKGLTTAASLWTVAGIGLAVGAGFYQGAVITTFLIILILLVLEFLEKKILTVKEYKQIILNINSLENKIEIIKAIFLKYRGKIKDLELSFLQSRCIIKIITKIPSDINTINNISKDLLGIKDIIEVEINNLE